MESLRSALVAEQQARDRHQAERDAAHLEVESLRSALAAEQEARDRHQLLAEEHYRHLTQRVHDAVRERLPKDATVAVVSKGDDGLLKLGSRRVAWHFPQTDDGSYAGHYPTDSAEAIAQLEALRAKGALYLVIPATSRWWLDHYSEFRAHLERRYQVLVDRDDTCVIFSLVGHTVDGNADPEPELVQPAESAASRCPAGHRAGD